MIEFKEIRYKNFLSSGNQFTSIVLNENTTSVIVGKNGAGKSTVLDALCFALFNKPFRKITKGQIVNSSNDKDCLVELEFSVNSTQYKIVRGIKPARFIIERNGNKLNEDSNAQDQQKALEEQILKLNYKSFTQIVILGSASFVPFMQLSTSHRREVIEDLLDIKVFSTMSDILKERVKNVKTELKTLDLKKQGVADKIIMQQNFIKTIEESGQSDIQNKTDERDTVFREMKEHQYNVDVLLTEVANKETEIKEYSDASGLLRKLGTFKGKLQSKHNNSTKERDFFQDNVSCPTCTQSIQDSFRVNKLGQLQKTISGFEENLQEIEDAISDAEVKENTFLSIQKEITKLSNEISQTNVRITESSKLCTKLEQEIQTITNRIENRNSEHEKLSSYKSQLKKVLVAYEKLKEDYEYFLEANVLLKDDGVKSAIIKKYIPLINQQVNRYLQMMDFYINFTLDEEFNENIESPIHDKFTYPSFSEGEKMRIDLALLFTWREIARMKNSIATNLLVMDEVFDSSLDGFGTDEFLKIIRYVVKDANIFVISHKQDLVEKFEKILEFDKVRGFSVLKA
tara:strand:- start:75 stop:1787 length:1713 start_codon:yes stop_codon:yes gene_type:complete